MALGRLGEDLPTLRRQATAKSGV